MPKKGDLNSGRYKKAQENVLRSNGSSSPAARSGYPNITVSMGFVHGLPMGISFFAEAFNEPKLIKHRLCL